MRRLPVVSTLITFIAVVIMFALGIWQLQRAEQKNQRLASIEQMQDATAIGLADVLSNINDMVDVPIQFDASPELTQYFLLDNKIHQGRVGYQVLVPLETKQGTLIANFGWVAATDSRAILPEVRLASTQQTYLGLVSFPSKNIMVTETAELDGKWPKVLQQVDLNVMQQHYRKPLLPFVVKLTEVPNSGFVREWQPVVMAPEKHIAYAVQWFLLALAAVIIFFIAQRKK
ncbi:SURF1 family protein [Paraglaciecola aquimarina]|uniref:SURF1-like protein n=1 Tax=Paraglaciecola aquimarina TaxID=1235557 RepID=A0ABU3STD0_9ALTE|nr:SURF1 family protein [Paraglaciecola aquimarina]MDU0353256.1 SURF1 family protein [Paraglaciecola aquimarina]